MSTSSRREFVKSAAVAAGTALVPRALGAQWLVRQSSRDAVGNAEEHGWERVPSILARIRPPAISRREFPITRYGAKADGVTDCTDAFRRAIAACAAAGGGRVVVAGGAFLTGPIHLRSRVNLEVQEGATIRFATDPKAYEQYVLTRFEGVELMGLSPLIYARDATDVAITGGGTLDGQSSPSVWWSWKGQAAHGWRQGMGHQGPARARLFDMAERDIPVASRRFGAESYLRPPFIQPYGCTNVLIEGVTIRNSPMWEINPVLCQNVIVRGVRIETHGPNNDGCDPESCRDVLIERCHFDTGTTASRSSRAGTPTAGGSACRRRTS